MQLSLRNSLLKGYRQVPFDYPSSGERDCFVRLGISHSTEKTEPEARSVEKHMQVAPRNSSFNAIETRVNELGLNEYDSCRFWRDPTAFLPFRSFPYEKYGEA